MHFIVRGILDLVKDKWLHRLWFFFGCTMFYLLISNTGHLGDLSPTPTVLPHPVSLLIFLLSAMLHWTLTCVSYMCLQANRSKKIPASGNTVRKSVHFKFTLLLSPNLVQMYTHIGSVWSDLSLTPFYHAVFKVILIRWVTRVSYPCLPYFYRECEHLFHACMICIAWSVNGLSDPLPIFFFVYCCCWTLCLFLIDL